jgi:hypothetical protein
MRFNVGRVLVRNNPPYQDDEALRGDRLPQARVEAPGVRLKGGLPPVRARERGTQHQGLTLVHVSAQLSAWYGIRGARRGCVARAKGMFGVVQGV